MFIEVTTIVSLIFVGVGLLLSFFEWKNANKTKRAEFVLQLFSEFNNDKDLVKMFYEIDHSNFEYKPGNKGTDEEIALDKLLFYFNNICFLYDQKLLNKREMANSDYFIKSIANNEEIKRYFAYLKSVHHVHYEIVFHYLIKYNENNKTNWRLYKRGIA